MDSGCRERGALGFNDNEHAELIYGLSTGKGEKKVAEVSGSRRNDYLKINDCIATWYIFLG